MNRLFAAIALALFCALALSLAVSWYLQEDPLFKADLSRLEASLESAADELRPILENSPVALWDELLWKSDLDLSFDITWYSIDDITIPIDEFIKLKLENRLIFIDTDNTPTAELLFSKQQMVLIMTPMEGYHRYLNTATSVLAILAICIAAAFLVLNPIIRRLKNLQSLADHYAQGQWHAENTDTSRDQIGELGTSMENMAHRIQHLIENNNSLVQDQRDLMQAVAHEFRAPMARMRFALEMHEEGAINDDASAEISVALDELNDMVSEVLQYSRMQLAAPELDYSTISLQQIITECANKCQLQFPDKKIFVQSDLPDCIDADPTHLQRALLNLISNAAKYGESEVTISADVTENTVLITVDDDGDGIPVEQRNRALKPFVRLDSSRTRKLGGTGLGLAIANGVALKHGGTLSITQSPAGGARLVMQLPVFQNL